MWLLLRKEDFERAYREVWQHVEAFRRLLRTTARSINGAPPENGTGVLDIEQLLLADLAVASRSRKAPPDKDKWGVKARPPRPRVWVEPARRGRGRSAPLLRAA
jgi:hypothetical protein